MQILLTVLHDILCLGIFSLRADVSYFLCSTRKRDAKEIGDVWAQDRYIRPTSDIARRNKMLVTLGA